MKIFFLELFRKISRSFLKYEIYLIEKIIFNKFKKNQKKIKIFNKITDLNFNNISKKKIHKPKKMEIVICFFYKERRIKFLKKILQSINLFNFKTSITILTNNITTNKKIKLKQMIKKSAKILVIKNIPEPNLLPWFCFDELKKKYNNKKNTHFLYLEDDILISDENVSYWVFMRNLLKKNDFIPGFIRYEKKNNNLYAIDYYKKIFLASTPRFFLDKKNVGIFNTKYPYHGACLFDRKLMKEYIGSKLVSIDLGFHHKILKNFYPIKELANIIIGFINVPNYLLNRFFIPFFNFNKIPKYCLIQHLDARFSREKGNNFSNIEVKNILN